MSKQYSLSDADAERQPSPSVRVLIVDDHDPWRRYYSTTLGKEQQLQIIGEASNGLEAVQQAQELQPDLILLDIGLPALNGIEAARRIRDISSASKILFVSEHRSADIVREALSTGARGYVVKVDAGRELIAAVTAVLRGEQFLGSRFAGHAFSPPSTSRTSHAIADYEYPASRSAPIQESEIAYRHAVHFYSDDESLLDAFTECIGTALEAGSAVIVFATESHRETLLLRLQAHGVDMTAAIDQGRYIPLDSVEILSRFMVDDMPDPTRLFKVLSDLVATVSGSTGAAHTRIVACGGLAPVLLSQGKPESAIRLEQLWDEVVKRYRLDTLCTYSQSSFRSDQGRDVFQRICGLHTSAYSR